MKLYIQIAICCILVSLVACASDNSASTNEVVSRNNTRSKATGTKKDGPAPELKVGNYTGSADPENAKKGMNAGSAYKLGNQMGKRFCECKEKELANDCQSKIINSLEALKRTLHPKIAEACEKSFLNVKGQCE